MSRHGEQAAALIASLLCAGQAEDVAESVQQRKARVHREFMAGVVNADIGFHVDSPPLSVRSAVHFLAALFRFLHREH
jgi:hypothetical protein